MRQASAHLPAQLAMLWITLLFVVTAFAQYDNCKDSVDVQYYLITESSRKTAEISDMIRIKWPCSYNSTFQDLVLTQGKNDITFTLENGVGEFVTLTRLGTQFVIGDMTSVIYTVTSKSLNGCAAARKVCEIPVYINAQLLPPHDCKQYSYFNTEFENFFLNHSSYESTLFALLLSALSAFIENVWYVLLRMKSI